MFAQPAMEFSQMFFALLKVLARTPEKKKNIIKAVKYHLFLAPRSFFSFVFLFDSYSKNIARFSVVTYWYL